MSSSQRFPSSRNAVAQQTASNSQLTSFINDNDVLLGRGNHVNHEGNLRFRKLVMARSVEYMSSDSKTAKDAIARQIACAVAMLGGRFIRKVAQDSALDKATPSWEIEDVDIVLIKVKQTFRDHAAANRRALGPFGAALSASRLHGVYTRGQRQDLNERAFHQPQATETETAIDPVVLHRRSLQGQDYQAPLINQPFNSLQTSQQQYLFNIYHQRINEQHQLEQQMLSLLGQQRAILASQLQSQSSPSETLMPGQFWEQAPRSPQASSGLQETMGHLAYQQQQGEERLAAWQATQAPVTYRAEKYTNWRPSTLQRDMLEILQQLSHPQADLGDVQSPRRLTPPISRLRESQYCSDTSSNYGRIACENPSQSLNTPIDPISLRTERFMTLPCEQPPLSVQYSEEDNISSRWPPMRSPTNPF